MIKRIIPFFLLTLSLTMVTGCSRAIASTSQSDSEPEFNGTHRTTSLRTLDDLELFAQYWEPESEPEALVLMLHGTTMHSGAYSEAARYLADNGYLVYGLDLRGWGRSDGHVERGFVESPEHYVLDLELAIQDLKNKYPGKKLYALGESLGATVSMYGYLKYGLPIDGMIFSGPGYKPNLEVLGFRGPQVLNDMGMALGGELGESIPSWPTLPSNGGIARVIDDPQVEKRLLNDPHVSHNFLPATYFTVLGEIDEYNQLNAEKLDLPLLIVHGEQDILIPISSSQEIINEAGGDNQTLKTYDSNHATLLDARRSEVYRDIEAWLDNQKKGTKKENERRTIKPEALSSQKAYDLGDLHFHHQHYKAAKKYFQMVQKKHPGHIDALMYLGLTELKMDSVERSQAIDRFNTVLGLDPDHELATKLIDEYGTKNQPPLGYW